MKILVISQYFWPEEFRINDICKGLIEKGHEVEVLTGIPNYPFGRYFDGYSIFNRGKKEYEGIKVRRAFCVPRGKDSKIKLILNYISFMISGIIHIPFIIANKYDKILVYQLSPITMAIPAILLKKIKKLPLDMYILDLWPESLLSTMNIKSRKIKYMLEKVCKYIYKQADQLYITSRGFKGKLMLYGIEEDTIKYLPQWAEDIYKNTEIDKSINVDIDDNKFNIVFTGNIGKAQSIDTIIDAANICKENKNINWIIVGDGSEKENSMNRVKELGLEDCILFLGRKPVSDMPLYYSKADALLVTLGNDELFKITVPAKVQSYMASGKPIIGAISGEGKYLIDECNCGKTCEAEDYIGLANIAQYMYSLSEEDRKYMGQNGLKYFNQNFKREILLDEINRLIMEQEEELVYV